MPKPKPHPHHPHGHHGGGGRRFGGWGRTVYVEPTETVVDVAACPHDNAVAIRAPSSGSVPPRALALWCPRCGALRVAGQRWTYPLLYRGAA